MAAATQGPSLLFSGQILCSLTCQLDREGVSECLCLTGAESDDQGIMADGA